MPLSLEELGPIISGELAAVAPPGLFLRWDLAEKNDRDGEPYVQLDAVIDASRVESYTSKLLFDILDRVAARLHERGDDRRLHVGVVSEPVYA